MDESETTESFRCSFSRAASGLIRHKILVKVNSGRSPRLVRTPKHFRVIRQSLITGISTVVPQLGLGRHLSGPPHGGRTSHIRRPFHWAARTASTGRSNAQFCRIVGRFHDSAEAAVTNVRSRPGRRRGNLSTKSTVQRSGTMHRTMKSEFEEIYPAKISPSSSSQDIMRTWPPSTPSYPAATNVRSLWVVGVLAQMDRTWCGAHS